MSKNFELLLQAGAIGHYFHDIDVTPPEKHPRPEQSRYQLPRNEEFDQLVRRVFLDSNHSRVRSLMVSSAQGAAPPAEACVQIGKSLASLADGSVCIVDANVALASLHRVFGDDNLVGLADALLQSRSAKSLARQVERSNLYFLPAGKTPANGRMAGVDFASPLEELKDEFDYLIVAAPPADGGKNLAAIGQACDGALLVLESGGVPLNVMLKIRRQFDTANIPLFGVVLNSSADHRNASSIISPVR